MLIRHAGTDASKEMTVTPRIRRLAVTVLARVPVALLILFVSLSSGLRAEPWDPAAADYTGRNGLAANETVFLQPGV